MELLDRGCRVSRAVRQDDVFLYSWADPLGGVPNCHNNYPIVPEEGGRPIMKPKGKAT